MNQRKTNILVIAPYRFLPVINGGHKAIEQLYSHLGSLAIVTVVSVKSNDESFAKNFRLVKLFTDSPLHYINPLVFFKLRKFIRKENITHLVTDHPYMGWLGFLLKQTLHIPWVMRSHNIEAMRFKTIEKWWWQAMWTYEKWVCWKADSIFFITEEDKQWACKNYSLPNTKGTVITFGIDGNTSPSEKERSEAADMIRRQYQIPSSHRLLLFNGDLGYEPNEAAVRVISEYIYPALKEQNFLFTVLICGRNLNAELVKQIEGIKAGIIYTGFVTDIRPFFLASDVFINPVISGGGIKTKLVEALGYGCSAVSTVSGATGIPVKITNGKLTIVSDNDWQAFAKAVIRTDVSLPAGDDFYGSFYWGNIARKALDLLESL